MAVAHAQGDGEETVLLLKKALVIQIKLLAGNEGTGTVQHDDYHVKMTILTVKAVRLWEPVTGPRSTFFPARDKCLWRLQEVSETNYHS